ncbi:MAG TPA: hypothetical protein VE953_08950 [Terriglobales bacterium]|nr:hypothetical protein [Terriglobales bacterium]
MSVRAIFTIGACSATVALLGGCGIVQVSHNTRYFATDRDAGKTIQLHKGDEVTLNLPIVNGRDWNASSSDTHIANPATTEVMTFSSGEKARFLDFALIGTGHVQLVACPTGSSPCSASTSGALTFDVDVA